MTLMFNAVEFIHRLEKAGIAREAAEAIAQGIEERNAQLATRQDLDRLATKQDVEVAISTAIAKQTIQFGVVTGAATAIIIAAVGVIVSIH